MSDTAPKPSHEHDAEHEPNHEGPIRTPKQLALAVFFSFVIPITVIVLLASYVTSGNKPAAGSDGLTPQATAARIAPVARVEVKDPSDVSALKAGADVYAAQCSACHAAGVAGAPKFGDAAAWAPRIATGYEALLTSSLKGKGAMGAQGGGDFSDTEIGRAVVHMANAGGAKFAEPKLPAAAASAPEPAPAAAPAPVTTAAPTAALAAPAAPAPPPPVVVAAAPAPAAAPAAAAPALYGQICSACHIAGVAGAPKLGDKAGWAPRLALGVDGLTASVVKGKGAMPPRGGSQASDAEIKAVVSYMVDSVK